MIQITCQYCGKKFYDYKCDKRKFCSRICHLKNRLLKLTNSLPKLNKTDWAYIAGIIDGEGTIFYGRRPEIRKDRNNKIYRKREVYFSVGNTDKELIYWLNKKIGGKTMKRIRPNRKPFYQIYFRINEMKNCIPNILPFLIIKRKMAKRLMKYLTKKYSLPSL